MVKPEFPVPHKQFNSILISINILIYSTKMSSELQYTVTTEIGKNRGVFFL